MRKRWLVLAVGALVVVNATPASVSAAGPRRGSIRSVASERAACQQPYAPVWSTTQSGTPTSPTPAIDVQDVTTPFSILGGRPPLDSDGDGVPDTVSSPGGSKPAVVTRGSGSLTLGRAGSGAEVISLGNLDGVKGDELGVVLVSSGFPAEAYIVPGGTPNGTYDPATVGIRVADGSIYPTPDRDGDGTNDVLVVSVAGQQPVVPPLNGATEVFSAKALLAVGVGGDARSVSPILQAPGVLDGYANFAGVPELITYDQSTDVRIIHLTNEQGSVAFAASPPSPGAVPLGGSGSRAWAYAGPSGRFIALGETDGGRYPNGTTYYWGVDRPCDALATALRSTTSTTAPVSSTTPAATPVRTTPSFTG